MEVEKNMNNSSAKEYLAPVLVLFIICLVVSFALAGTENITAPTIAKIEKETADAARAFVLPSGADGFTQYEGELVEGVTECYVADNQSGIAVTATYKSFGGTITVMVGVAEDGTVTGVSVTDHADTPGLGTKPMAEDYLQAQYTGVSELPADQIKSDPQVSAITGATVSSNAIYHTVKEALEQFSAMGGVA